VLSFGTAAYAVGKFTTGQVVDAMGPRKSFAIASLLLCALYAAFSWILVTDKVELVGIPSVYLFTAAWCGTRYVQSGGYPALAIAAANWFKGPSFARTWAILATSSRAGSALGALAFGAIIGSPLGWQAVPVTVACLTGAWVFVVVAGLRDAPPTGAAGDVVTVSINGDRVDEEVSEGEGEADAVLPPARTVSPGGEELEYNVDLEGDDDVVDDLASGEDGARDVDGTDDAQSMLSFLRQDLMRSGPFYLVVVVMATVTSIFEFTSYVPLFFHQVGGMHEGTAAAASSVFPICSVLWTLVAGTVTTRWGQRAELIAVCSGAVSATASLAMLAWIAADTTVWSHPSVFVVMFVGGMGGMAPAYYLPTTRIAMHLGKGRRRAFVLSLVDAVGYVTTVAYFKGTGSLSWSVRLACLTAFAVVCTVAFAILYGCYGGGPGAEERSTSHSDGPSRSQGDAEERLTPEERPLLNPVRPELSWSSIGEDPSRKS
jgi:sugar phosphate permease